MKMLIVGILIYFIAIQQMEVNNERAALLEFAINLPELQPFIYEENLLNNSDMIIVDNAQTPKHLNIKYNNRKVVLLNEEEFKYIWRFHIRINAISVDSNKAEISLCTYFTNVNGAEKVADKEFLFATKGITLRMNFIKVKEDWKLKEKCMEIHYER